MTVGFFNILLVDFGICSLEILNLCVAVFCNLCAGLNEKMFNRILYGLLLIIMITHILRNMSNIANRLMRTLDV